MPARAARTRTHKTYADGSSSDSSNAEDTPKANKNQRPGKKKRLSEVLVPLNGSVVEARTPLRSVDINDDTAEKRRRRKSTKIFQSSKDDAEAMENGGTPRAGAHARANQLNVVEDAPVINVPLDVMSSNFEEWMKMATDNKINAANSWNFALIDYFHDMSLLRNVTDNSINFQKASCTLDGCVKIWTSRVDSVGTETGKLLSNLASEGRDNGDVANPDDDAEPDGEGSKKRTKAHRPEATLAKNAAQLRTKKLELEFSVDPLFKKTCADFDESGAQGLLMNHLALGLGGSLRVVFDAGDSAGAGGGEDEVGEPDEPEDLVNLSFLRKEFIPSLEVLDNKAISHSLEGFSFQRDAFSFNDVTFLNTTALEADTQSDEFTFEDDGGCNEDTAMDLGGSHAGGGPVEDFFVGEQAVHDDYGDDLGAPDAGMDTIDGENLRAAEGNEPGARPDGAFQPFDPRSMLNERDLVMAMTNGDDEGGMMDYFDPTFLKNWAGPEHWKLRKIVRRAGDASEPAAPKAKREKKEAFKIDFGAPLETPIQELFAPVTGRGASISLPGSKIGIRKSGKKKNAKESAKRNDQTLPPDMHFSSRQLVTLFLKPKFSLKMRGYRVKINEADGEVDENFWAQAAADQAAGLRANEADETVDGGAIPFNTQFFHDDYDDGPGFDDGYDGEGDAGSGSARAILPEDQDLLATTQGQGRRVRPEFVNYAKRAKRVDVRKLKENIWKGLNIAVSDPSEDGQDLASESNPLTDASEARVFKSVIADLQESYPREKMEEISTSFCFICLLHLANERGLKIEVGENDVSEDGGRNVGNLWDLRVCRDLNATPAA